MKIQTCLWILIILTANQSRRLLSNVCGCQKEIGVGGYFFYYHLHTVVYHIHHHTFTWDFYEYFCKKDFKLHLLKVGVHFCSPQREKDTPESLVSLAVNMSACCKAGPSSILGSAPQEGFPS
jgi:hypothetical protein